MKRVLLAGATGALGTELLQRLHHSDYYVRTLLRDPDKESWVRPYCDEVFIGDATNPSAIAGACQSMDIVVSTLGKSVSLFTNSPASFYDIDYHANAHLLDDALAAGVRRFVYVSIFGSETSPRLRVGWAHELFAQKLMQAPLSYTIIKPVGMFTGLHDLIIMGKKGLLVTPGNGRPITNPIHQQDLARVCEQVLEAGPTVMDVGGPEIHSRNEVAQSVAASTGARTFNLPHGLVQLGLPMVRLISRNLYDKLRYFTYITTHDMVAPPYGEQTFEEYLKAQEMVHQG